MEAGEVGGVNFTAVDTEQQTLASCGKAGKTGNGAVTFCGEAGKKRMEKDDSSVLICRENICAPPEAAEPSSFPPFASDFCAKCYKSSFQPCGCSMLEQKGNSASERT